MGALRIHRHAEVAQADGDAVEGVGERAERLVEFQAVIGGLGGAQARELVTRRPVETAGIDDGAAGHGAVAGQVLGGRVNDERRAKLDGTAEIRRGRRVVDDEGQPGLVGDGRDGRDVGDVAARICDALAEERARVVIDGGPHRVHIVEIDEPRAPAEARDGLAELGDRATIESGRDDDVAPGRHQREERHDLCGMPRRAADGSRTALERGDAFLQDGNRGVGQARIDEAHFLKVEEGSRVIGVAKDEGGRLVDRRLTRAGGRIGPRSGMNLQCVEAVAPALGLVVHPALPRASCAQGGLGESGRADNGACTGTCCPAWSQSWRRWWSGGWVVVGDPAAGPPCRTTS